MFAKIVAGTVVEYPYGGAELRRDFPNTSFPVPMTDAEYAAYDVLPVSPRNPPVFDHVHENCVRVDPTKVDGEWVETWSVEAATPSEVEQRTTEKAAEVRSTRNRLLAECDWTMLPDAPTDHTAWAAYRQQLRDVTGQAGFPLNVIWPEQPSS